MSIRDEIAQKLQHRFQPTHLEVLDESQKHIGHAGYNESGESHFRIIIRAPDFAGQSRLARHRAVHDALGKEIVERIHALALDIDA